MSEMTDEMAREWFLLGVAEDAQGVGMGAHYDREFCIKKFDRWLAAHDAEVRADATEKAVQAVLAEADRRWGTNGAGAITKAFIAAIRKEGSHE